MTTTINSEDGTYLNIDMWYDNEFVPGQYGADSFFNDNSAIYWGWIYDENGKMIGSYETDDSVLVQENFLIDWAGDQRGADLRRDIRNIADKLGSTITAATSQKPTNTIIYRLPNGDCYGYADSGKKIESSCWDWCGMDIIIQNLMDQTGVTEDEGVTMFWNMVHDYDPTEFDYCVEPYGGDALECIGDGNPGLNELRTAYLESLGFTEVSADQDVTTCDSVEGTTEPKYMANMVTCATDDDYTYYIAGYRDNLMRSLYDSLSTDSFDAVLDFANDLAHDDCFIQIKNLKTGSEVFYDASAWYNDVPEDVFEVTM